jgi:hypothetical protein
MSYVQPFRPASQHGHLYAAYRSRDGLLVDVAFNLTERGKRAPISAVKANLSTMLQAAAIDLQYVPAA